MTKRKNLRRLTSLAGALKIALLAGIAALPAAPLCAQTPAKTFVWPTPMRVTAETDSGKIVQPAASGIPATGLFGFARNGGTRFHEGLDIRPISRDKKNEPTDTICAALAGTVAHIAPEPNGTYGRYIVLTHRQDGLVFYTLYAHLRSVSPALKTGNRVSAGTALGVMGRSDNKGGFAKERAHLHIEVGLILSRTFDNWYARQKDFGTPNKHGNYNGLNLDGIDPLPFLRAGIAAGKPPALLTFLKNEETTATVFVSENRIPNFVLENPALVIGKIPAKEKIAGWKIEFARHGLPVRWTPLTVAPGAGTGIKKITPSGDKTLCRDAANRGLLVTGKKGNYSAGETLKNAVEILFDR